MVSCLRCSSCTVASVHKLGILHRGLKPSNVMIVRESRTINGASQGGCVMLIDFGFAIKSKPNCMHWL
jgi:serine/threonine protein kinase